MGVVDRAARPGGRVLAVLVGALAAVRRGRPMHPEGVTLRGRLQLHDDPLGEAPGVGYDGPALVRVSRSAGLPPALPDVHGVSVRWEAADGSPRDLLLAGTGTGRLGRFALAPRRRPWAGAFGTMMPFRTVRGPVVLAAVPTRHATGDTRSADLHVDLVLLAARPAGPWRPCGRLVADRRDDTVDPRFDPVLHAPFGTYAWAAALRRPAYAAGRRHGGGSLPVT